MTRTSKRIIFFGTEDFSLVTLRALVDAGFLVEAVVTKPDMKKGRGHTLSQPAVKTYAVDQGITVWQPTKLTDIADDITALDQPLGVLVSYGKLIPQSIIDLFSPGIINIHPSLLPRYRGPSPIESAIANGDQETGVTLMQLSAQMDAGPLYAYTPLELTGRETAPELYHTLGEIGAQMLLRILPDIFEGTLADPQPQNDDDATYCALLTKADGILDPATLTAVEAERRVRAYLTYPRSRVVLGSDTLIVTAAHIADTAHSDLDIRFKDGAYLSIDKLIAPSGKTMLADAYLRGRRNQYSA